ncbi:MAG: hypothetical protein NVS4B2_27770 [Chloroflexota bacterium]
MVCVVAIGEPDDERICTVKRSRQDVVLASTNAWKSSDTAVDVAGIVTDCHSSSLQLVYPQNCALLCPLYGSVDVTIAVPPRDAVCQYMEPDSNPLLRTT